MNTVLFIEDEKPISDVVKSALTKFGYQVETAGDGEEGIRKFNNSLFDVVITDIRLPGIDGHGVVRHVRSCYKKSTKVIGISGTPWLLKNSDFDIVIEKPFGLKILVESIENLIASSKLADASTAMVAKTVLS